MYSETHWYQGFQDGGPENVEKAGGLLIIRPESCWYQRFPEGTPGEFSGLTSLAAGPAQAYGTRIGHAVDEFFRAHGTLAFHLHFQQFQGAPSAVHQQLAA